jgi:hypothetical protein
MKKAFISLTFYFRSMIFKLKNKSLCLSHLISSFLDESATYCAKLNLNRMERALCACMTDDLAHDMMKIIFDALQIF